MSEHCPVCFMAEKFATKADAFCAGVAVALLDVPPEVYCDLHRVKVVTQHRSLVVELATQTDWSGELVEAQECLRRARLRELPS